MNSRITRTVLYCIARISFVEIVILRTEEMELARLTFNDFDRILAFEEKNFPSDPWGKEIWEELLTDDECYYYAYLVNSEIAANVFIAKNPLGYIKIMNLAVAEEYRGRGIAVKLLNYITDHYTKEGYSQFKGETRESNLAMQQVFEKSGYQRTSLHENMYDKPRENGLKYRLIK